MQTPGLDLSVGYNLIVSLDLFIQDYRENIEDKIIDIEHEAANISQDSDYDKNKRNITKKFADGTRNRELLKGKAKFRVEMINVCIDTISNAILKRSKVYQEIGKRFQFLFDLGAHNTINDQSIKSAFYSDDLDDKLHNECIQFNEYLILRRNDSKTEENLSETSVSCIDMLNIIYEHKII